MCVCVCACVRGGRRDSAGMLLLLRWYVELMVDD